MSCGLIGSEACHLNPSCTHPSPALRNSQLSRSRCVATCRLEAVPCEPPTGQRPIHRGAKWAMTPLDFVYPFMSNDYFTLSVEKNQSFK
jgi:hypothetical protein